MRHQVAYVFIARPALVELCEKEHLAINLRSRVWVVYEGGRVYFENTAARMKMKFLVCLAKQEREAFARLSKDQPISLELFDRYWTLDRAFYQGEEEALDLQIADFDRSTIPASGNEFVDDWIRLGSSEKPPISLG